MSFLSKLFSRKTNEQQPKEAAGIGMDIDRPAPIGNPISDYLNEIPEWIGRKSGWGYGKDDALIMAVDNSMEGIHNEYVFAEFRSKVEVHEVMKMYFDHFERCNQRLVNSGMGHNYDVINFKVYFFTEERSVTE